MTRTQVAFTLLTIIALVGWGSWWICSAECQRLARCWREERAKNAVRANAMAPQVLDVLAQRRANRGQR